MGASMMRGASHVGGVVASCAVLVCSGLFPSVVSMVGVSSGSGAVPLCGSSGVSQGASLRVVPFARRAVGVFARMAAVVALSGPVAVGAGGIASALWVFALLALALMSSALTVSSASVLVPVSMLLLPGLSSSAPPFVSSLSRGVVSCPVSPRAMVWSAAACSWMARLARSMSPLARASACASAVMRSACSRASLIMASASLRASAMMVSACSRAWWSAFSRVAVMASSGLAVCAISLPFIAFLFLVFVLLVCAMWLRRHRGLRVRVRWRRRVAITLFR